MTQCLTKNIKKIIFLKNQVEIILQKDTIKKGKFIGRTWKQSPSGRRNTYQTWYISRDYPVWRAKRKRIKKKQGLRDTRDTNKHSNIHIMENSWKETKAEKIFEEILGKNYLNVMKNNFCFLVMKNFNIHI